MKITRRQLIRIIREELRMDESYYDTNRDQRLGPEELRQVAQDLEGGGDKPLAKLGGPHDCGSDYHYDRVNGVCVRNDYDPRTDYGEELGKAVRQLQTQE
jgi:hypothetical protein